MLSHRFQAVLALALAGSVGASVLQGCGGGGGGGGFPPAASTVAPSTSANAPAAVVVSSTASSAGPRTKSGGVVVARSSDGNGFLEMQNGRRLLHVKGTSWDRGVQYGELVGDQIANNLQVMGTLAKSYSNLLPPTAVPILSIPGSQVYKGYYTQESLDMIHGICEGARRRTPQAALREEDLVFLNAIVDLAATVQVPLFKCSGTAVWGPLSQGGKMYQQRNIDLFVGSGLESSSVLVIEKPDQGYAFGNAGYCGLIGVVSGMNQHGVGVSQVWAFSYDSGLGQPWPITTRRMLLESQNVDNVWPIFSTTKRTYGTNFVFADRGDGRGGQPRGISLDSNHAMLAQFGDADPAEDGVWQGISLPVRIPFAVFRGDQSMCQKISDRHYHLDPAQDPRDKGGYKLRYKQQADMIQAYAQAGTKIGAPEMIAIARQIAMGSDSLQCVVYENADLAIHVANSRVIPGGAVKARDEPFERFDVDYYLPTATVAVDRATFASGDTVTLRLDAKNDGRSRELDAHVMLEVAGAQVPLAVVKVEALTGKPTTLSFPVAIPAGVAPGIGRISVELDETGTRDVVDYAAVAVSVR